MGLVIAGERSGCGKTTVTLMLLAALCRKLYPDQTLQSKTVQNKTLQNKTVQSFKVGPDYIDPMFHRYVTGRPCYNLDPVLTSPDAVQHCFTRHQTTDYSLVEGVMGLFDGPASTADIAKLLGLPIVLVIDCSRLSGSVAAIAQGYRTFDPSVQMAGVILNRVGSDRHLKLLKAALEPLNLPTLGVLRRHQEITLPDRHLGLVPTDELPELNRLVDRLAEIGAESFDWEKLLPLLKSPSHQISVNSQGKDGRIRQSFISDQTTIARVAVARDRAFNFHYAENLELLKQLGAELVFWSPLEETLPSRVTHLYLSGGFPEVFAEQLSQNYQALKDMKQAVTQGLPTYAECGGLMYLCEALQDFEGRRWPMVGVLPTVAVMEGLTLGYRRAIAQCDTPLLQAGQQVWGHEFHHSRLEPEPREPLYQVFGSDLSDVGQGEGWSAQHWPQANLHASYVHLHWGAQPQIAQRFLEQ